jgi:hypothetical protein
MSDTRDKRAAEIQDSIRQILFYGWDPIGVRDFGHLDEYDSYIASIYRILASSRSEEELIKFLDWTERNTVGMPNNSREKLRPIAKKLLALNVKL